MIQRKKKNKERVKMGNNETPKSEPIKSNSTRFNDGFSEVLKAVKGEPKKPNPQESEQKKQST